MDPKKSQLELRLTPMASQEHFQIQIRNSNQAVESVEVRLEDEGEYEYLVRAAGNIWAKKATRVKGSARWTYGFGDNALRIRVNSNIGTTRTFEDVMVPAGADRGGWRTSWKMDNFNNEPPF